MSWTDDDLDLALRGLRDEELPAGATEAVRARVMGQVSARRRWGWWGWAAVAAAAAVAVFLMVGPSRRTVEVAEQPGKKAVETVAAVVETPHTKSAPDRRTVAGALPLPYGRGSERRRGAGNARRVELVRSEKASGETEFVHVMTDDPDVVILWAMDSKGDK